MAIPTKADVTIVRNTSGVTMYFDFLGPRGATLAAGADMAIPGNIFSMWHRNPQKSTAIENALIAGRIEILQTPQNFVFDTAATRVRVLASSSNAATVADPDYGSYTGAAPSV